MRHSLVRILFVCGVFAGFGAGCHDRLYDSGETISLVDGGLTHADAGSGGKIAAGDAGVGGATGAGGDTGAGGASNDAGTGTGGNSNLCDNNSPLRQTDVANCGTCFNQCYQMNADATCVAGACQYACLTGFFDADKNPANGCECEITNGGVELCDGVDNDCNGVVDDGFDLMSDLNNCGGCSMLCYHPFAASSCDMGVCSMGACLPDFFDTNMQASDGCEAYCQKTNGGVEICDGRDNDCNGLIDDNVAPPTIVCRSQGSICQGIVPVCMGSSGYVCPYRTGYQDIEDTTLGCDGLDNDCDGQTDEPFQIGKSCVAGQGVCAAGTWVCDNTQTGNHRCQSTKTATMEICDGVDNDCDGQVDELSVLADTHNESLVIFTPTGSSTAVTMFAYEASHVDAGKDMSNKDIIGTDTTHRPCSAPGKLPWTSVKKEDAEAACEKIGDGKWRLCTFTEWAYACNRGTTDKFPYGATFSKTTCNGYDYGAGAPITGGTATGCTSDLGMAIGKVYDLSGNTKEWVATTLSGTTPFHPTAFEMRGGAYNTLSFVDSSSGSAVTIAPGLQCDSTTPAPSSDVLLPSVGFRCCHPGALN